MYLGVHVHCDPIHILLELHSCRSELAESRKRKKVVPKSNYRDKYEHLIGGADDVARVGSKGSVEKDACYSQYMSLWEVHVYSSYFISDYCFGVG